MSEIALNAVKDLKAAVQNALAAAIEKEDLQIKNITIIYVDKI